LIKSSLDGRLDLSSGSMHDLDFFQAASAPPSQLKCQPPFCILVGI